MVSIWPTAVCYTTGDPDRGAFQYFVGRKVRGAEAMDISLSQDLHSIFESLSLQGGFVDKHFISVKRELLATIWKILVKSSARDSSENCKGKRRAQHCDFF